MRTPTDAEVLDALNEAAVSIDGKWMFREGAPGLQPMAYSIQQALAIVKVHLMLGLAPSEVVKVQVFEVIVENLAAIEEKLAAIEGRLP